MKKAIINTTLLIFAVILLNSVTAQNNKPLKREISGITVLNYPALKPYFEKNNDTTYIVNFWATWCAPCIKELPYFQKIQEKFRDQKVKVLLVSLDFEKQIESKLVPFIRKNNITTDVIVLSDPASNEWINKIDPSWSGALPATLFINKNRKQFYEKEFTYEEIRSVIFEMNPNIK